MGRVGISEINSLKAMKLTRPSTTTATVRLKPRARNSSPASHHHVWMRSFSSRKLRPGRARISPASTPEAVSSRPTIPPKA